jgi:hypothetical protein
MAASITAAEMIQDNTDHYDVWMPLQIAQAALDEGDTMTAEQFVLIHVECYGDDDLTGPLAELYANLI